MNLKSHFVFAAGSGSEQFFYIAKKSISVWITDTLNYITLLAAFKSASEVINIKLTPGESLSTCNIQW